jgi:hypothetical protein
VTFIRAPFCKAAWPGSRAEKEAPTSIGRADAAPFGAGPFSFCPSSHSAERAWAEGEKRSRFFRRPSLLSFSVIAAESDIGGTGARPPDLARGVTIETKDILRAMFVEAEAFAAPFSESNIAFSEITMVLHGNFHAV